MRQAIQDHALYRWAQRHMVLHPLLFAVAPIVTLIAHNSESEPLLGVRAMVILALGTTLSLVFLQRFIPDKHRAAMVCSLFLLLFFSYGHVYFGLVTQSTLGLFSGVGLVGNHLVLGITWTVLFIAGVWITIRVKIGLENLTKVMNLMAVATLLVPLVNLSRYELQRIQHFTGNESFTASFANHDLEEAVQPDIYYIILDGYGRADILEELYVFDNTNFIAYLENLGFIVVPQSRSNYILTSLSLASSLNMNYLQDLQTSPVHKGEEQQTLARMIRDSAVREFLELQGYRTVAFASGYRPTELRNADRFLDGTQRNINPMEGLLLETSAFAASQALASELELTVYFPGYDSHRDRISYILDALPEVADLPGPKFIFVHLVIPHPPFIFDEEGGAVSPRYRYTLMDGDAFPGTEDEYAQGYRAQLTFINDRMKDLISALLSRSQRPMVLILQGDHGPGMQLNYQSADDTNLEERLGIFSAIYTSDGKAAELGFGLSPVNTFRVLFNRYFHTDFPLLPDRSYYSTLDNPLDFVEVP